MSEINELARRRKIKELAEEEERQEKRMAEAIERMSTKVIDWSAYMVKVDSEINEVLQTREVYSHMGTLYYLSDEGNRVYDDEHVVIKLPDIAKLTHKYVIDLANIEDRSLYAIDGNSIDFDTRADLLIPHVVNSDITRKHFKDKLTGKFNTVITKGDLVRLLYGNKIEPCDVLTLQHPEKQTNP